MISSDLILHGHFKILDENLIFIKVYSKLLHAKRIKTITVINWKAYVIEFKINMNNWKFNIKNKS